MTRYKSKAIYLFLFAGAAILFSFCWCVPAFGIMENLKMNAYFRQNETALFLNIMANGNYINDQKIVVLYLVFFVLAQHAVLFPDKPGFVVRLRSRNEFITRNFKTILLYSFGFVFLLESINILFAFFTFSNSVVTNSGLLLYSLIDFVTLFLFYLRAGLLLLVASILFNKNLAPFIVLAIYFLEFFANDFFPPVQLLWLPFRDAISITHLLARRIQPADTLPAIIRGVVMDAGLLWYAYFLFVKKDMVVYEKK